MTQLPPYRYTYPPDAPREPGARPGTVTWAAALLPLAVVSNMALWGFFFFDILFSAKDSSGDAIAAAGLGGYPVVMGIVTVLTAIGILRGQNTARNAARVICALSWCGCGFPQFFLVGTMMEIGVEVSSRLVAALLGFLALICYVAVAVSLSLPTAVDWFWRHRDAMWSGAR